MRFPATSAAINFLMDPARKNVLFNQFAYPALQVQSVMNKATNMAIIQSTGSNQPVWSANAIQGTYSARNNPGVLGSYSPAGIAGLKFSGSQYLEQDSVASVFAAPESALTVVAVVSPASSGGTIWAFADSTDTYKLSLSYSAGSLSLSEVNSHGTYSTTFAITHDTVHVVTAIRSNNTLVLRVDGSQVGTAAVTAGTAVPTTFTVGALNSNGSVSSQFNGALGKVAVYQGAADVYQVETFLLLEAGVVRGASYGLNSGF